MMSILRGATVPESSSPRERNGGPLRVDELPLDGFAREALEQEARRMGVSPREVMTFAVLYYLADLDSGRIAREISTSPYGSR
jgi:hypothetical protein